MTVTSLGYRIISRVNNSKNQNKSWRKNMAGIIINYPKAGGERMKINKHFIKTQLVSFLCAFISVLHFNATIRYNLTDVMFYTLLISIPIIYTLLISFLLDGRWSNILLVCLPFLVYQLAVAPFSRAIIPVPDMDELGLATLIGFIWPLYWKSIAVASIVGTFLKRAFHQLTGDITRRKNIA